jgi:NAD(P)-dependent dehydrogenase (short-subunit alcohol dehydrogenase family)
MSCGNTALKSQTSENYVFAGQRALVTGANSGIGAAIAQALAVAGAAVVVNYGRGQEEAERVVVRIKSEGGRPSRYRPLSAKRTR